MSKLFLGVDTSNYTTSIALCSHGRIIKSVRKLLPVKDGEKGLRQSDAVFLHTKALPELCEELFSCSEYKKENLAAVGVSFAPRDEAGSYMPCFLAGISFAKAVSASHNIPLYEFSHQSGHIRSGVYSCGVSTNVFEKEFISFHVSGGTTEALLVKPTGAYYEYKIIGGTNDASAGQIIDRAGVLSGLSFPCGKALDELSQRADKKLTPFTSMNGTYFSLSGLQNKYEKYISDGESVSNASRFVFESIARTLEKCTKNIRDEYGNLAVLYAGGVMSNSVIREQLSKLDNTYFASYELSCDNACGTALLCEDKFNS